MSKNSYYVGTGVSWTLLSGTHPYRHSSTEFDLLRFVGNICGQTQGGSETSNLFWGRGSSASKERKRRSMNALTSVLPPSNVVVLFERLSPSGLGWPLRITHAPNLPLPALRGAADAHGMAPNDELFSHARCGKDPRRWKFFCTDGQSSTAKEEARRKGKKLIGALAVSCVYVGDLTIGPPLFIASSTIPPPLLRITLRPLGNHFSPTL